MALVEDLLNFGHQRVHFLRAPRLDIDHIDHADYLGRAAERAGHSRGLTVDRIAGGYSRQRVAWAGGRRDDGAHQDGGSRHPEHLSLGGFERDQDHVILILAVAGLSLHRKDADHAEREIFHPDFRAHRVLVLAEQIGSHGLPQQADRSGVSHIIVGEGAAPLHRPVTDFQIVGRRSGDAGAPVTITAHYLRDLPIHVADQRDRPSLLLDRVGIRDREGRIAARPGTHAVGGGRTGQDDEEVGSEALDLRLDRLARTVAHRNHRDDRCNPNEDSQHGEQGAQLIALERARCRAQCHRAEYPGLARRVAIGRRGRRLRRRNPCLGPALRRMPLARVGYDLSVAKGYDPISVLRDFCIVGDQDDGNPLIAVKPADDVHDLGRVGRVQISGRLVGEQNRRSIYQSPRDRDALLLSAGKLVGMVRLTAVEAEHLHQVLGASLARSAPRGVKQRQLDIFQCAGACQQIEILEYESYFAAANRGEGFFG